MGPKKSEQLNGKSRARIAPRPAGRASVAASAASAPRGATATTPGTSGAKPSGGKGGRGNKGAVRREREKVAKDEVLKARREKEAAERLARSELRTEGVTCTGERTWEERDAELRSQAVEVDAE